MKTLMLLLSLGLLGAAAPSIANEAKDKTYPCMVTIGRERQVKVCEGIQLTRESNQLIFDFRFKEGGPRNILRT